MALPLKRMNLMLDEPLVKALRRESLKRRTSMSELVRSLLARDLGLRRNPEETLERIRALRETIGPLSDSTAIIREYRDRGW